MYRHGIGPNEKNQPNLDLYLVPKVQNIFIGLNPKESTQIMVPNLVEDM